MVAESRQRAEVLKSTTEGFRRAKNDAAWVADHRVALSWIDAERELDAKSQVTPALKP
jgi:hypothetical protein